MNDKDRKAIEEADVIMECRVCNGNCNNYEWPDPKSGCPGCGGYGYYAKKHTDINGKDYFLRWNQHGITLFEGKTLRSACGKKLVARLCTGLEVAEDER